MNATLTASRDTAEVVERYQQMVYAICLTHTCCRPDAEDVFQEVFLTYHRKHPVCNDEEHRKAWLITTTLNLARRVSTSSWRTRVQTLPDAEPEADIFSFGIEEYDELFAALTSIPEAYRTVIYLFYFEDQPIKQIANVLGEEQGAIKMRLSRGRQMLREAMTKETTHV